MHAPTQPMPTYLRCVVRWARTRAWVGRGAGTGPAAVSRACKKRKVKARRSYKLNGSVCTSTQLGSSAAARHPLFAGAAMANPAPVGRSFKSISIGVYSADLCRQHFRKKLCFIFSPHGPASWACGSRRARGLGAARFCRRGVARSARSARPRARRASAAPRPPHLGQA